MVDNGEAKGSTSDSNKSENVNVPLWKVWGLLRPTLSSVFKDEKEVLGMVVICLCRAAEISFTTEAVRMLDSTLATRSVAVFKRGLRRYVVIAFAGSWLKILYSYIQARLTWKWRKKLTDKIQAEYFSGLNYYLIGDGGGRGKDKMSDADTRITEDLRQTIDEFAKCFSDGLFTCSAGVFYTFNIMRLFGWRYAIAPYAYLAAATAVVDFIAPVIKTWRRLGRLRGQSWGSYRFALTRLGLQAESIASLKGAAYEHKHIREEYAVHRHDIITIHKAYFKFGIVNCFFMHHFLDQFVAIFCIGRGILYPAYDSIDSIDKMAEVRSNVGVQWVLFTNTMAAARVVVEMLRTMQQLVGNVERVTDLLELLDRVKTQKAEELSRNIVPGDSIAFDAVDIYTPADVLLVKGLTFKLEKGGSLLLTGHNGAGKSSIFRCLGGLWQIPSGSITRPGGAANASGENQDVFYIPQRPYNVLGTLQDQMTYPDTTGAEQLKRERLLEILSQVDLEHLLEREGALTDEINWEDELSLGEKQRLAIARLIHHRPRFAILDECSSAISSEMERRLYRICNEANVTYITIAHRPALRAYHDNMLAIGDGRQGFSLSKVDRTAASKRTLEMARRSVVSDDVEQSIKRHTEARSERFKAARVIKPMPDKPTLQRFLRLCKIGMPQYMLPKMLALGFLLGLQTWVEDFQMANTGAMFGCLMEGAAGLRGMLRISLRATLAALLQGVVWESMLFVQREAGADLAAKVENNMLDRLCSNNNFFVISHLDARIKDYEQRIGDDVHGLFHWALGSVIIGGLRPLSKLVWFTYRIGTILGFVWPLGMWAYMFASVGCLKLVMPDYRFISSEGSRLEAKFKFVHTRVKTCAESIAFFGGGDRELQIVNKRFHAMLAHDWMRLVANFKFQIVEDVFRSRVPDILQWVLRFTYGVSKGGTDEAILADGGADLNLRQTQLVSMSGMVFGELGVLIGLAEKFATIAGKTQRVAELQEVLDEIEADPQYNHSHPIGDRLLTKMPPIDAQRKCHSTEFYLQEAWPEAGGAHVVGDGTERNEGAKIKLDGVDLVTPRGEAVATNVSCEIAPSKALMVTGRNATGKTSFVRVLAGLWPHTEGDMSVPCPVGSTLPGLKNVFVVPQRIHMALGSLADQVTYPLKIPTAERTAEKEAELMALLDQVGIGYLVSRWAGDAKAAENHKGWDHETRWEDVLSLGEQQRLSLARCFYHRPVFAVLDECTSAVSIDVEEQLYRSANANGITCITVSQRLSLPEFHSHELMMGEDNVQGHTLRQISKELASMANLRDGRAEPADVTSLYLASSTGESYQQGDAADGGDGAQSPTAG